MLSENHRWNILGDHFKTKGFVHHQTESFDQFINVEMPRIISEEPPLLIKRQTEGKNINIMEYESYSIDFSDVYVPKPTVTEEDRVLRGFLPGEARQRDLSYDSPVYVTVTTTLNQGGGEPPVVEKHMRVVIGRIPIMLRSSHCYLTDMTPPSRIRSGECEYDSGGYFIVRGKERVLVPQLRGIYNIPIVIKQKARSKFSYVTEIRSMSDETGHSVLLQALIGQNDRTLVFSLPYIKEHIPIGVVFKALGYLKGDEIRDLIGLDSDRTEKYLRLIVRDAYFCEEQTDGFQLFSTQDDEKLKGEKRSAAVFVKLWSKMNSEEKEVWRGKMTCNNALKYIGQFTLHTLKECDRENYARQVVETELFPHMGITSSIKEKAYLLGRIVNHLLSTKVGMREEDDRDDYRNKRVESAGVLCRDLFRQLFKKFTIAIVATVEKKKQSPDIMSIISRLPVITNGLRHCFGTGNWGVPKNSYIRSGVAQILSRLSFGATLSNLRRCNIPVGKESKNTKIRQVHPSQIMFICPAETPEGAPVGIVLNFSLLTRISRRFSTVLAKEVVESCESLITLKDFEGPNTKTQVFLNGSLIGMTDNSDEMIEDVIELRNVELLPYDVSISYDDIDDEIHIFSDDGRLMRPVFTVEGDKLRAKEDDGVEWDSLVSKGLIRYVDNNEINNAVIAFNQNELCKYKNDYCEIAPAMMLGVMASIIPFPDHSQSPRNCYQAAMGKQAMSMYTLSHLVRADTITHVLSYPQKPLVSTKAANMMGFGDMPSGINTVVAIACYGGFNQEDSVILNHGAVQRGLFWATTYRTHSQQEKKRGTYTFEKIGVPPLDQRRGDVNYSLLDENGVVRLRHPIYKDEDGKTCGGGAVFVQEGDVLIGKILIQGNKSGDEELSDISLIIKKGEDGYVDRIFKTITPDGYILAKVVVRKNRIPEVGDKFASRAAQKGTCISGGELVSLSNGLSKQIKDMKPTDKVWGYTKEGLVTESCVNMSYMGEKETLKITMGNGQDLTCTKDHRIMTKNGWKEAQELLHDDEVVANLPSPLDEKNDDENGWSISTDCMTLDMNSGRDKTLAFSRILGFVIANGNIRLVQNQYCARVVLETLVDVNLFISDIKILIKDEMLNGKKINYEDTYRLYEPETCNETWYESWYVYTLPEYLANMFVSIQGIPLGKRNMALPTLPDFLDHAPKSVIREFLGGLFGGSGFSPCIDTASGTLRSVEFAWSGLFSNVELCQKHITSLDTMLTKCGVTSSVHAQKKRFNLASQEEKRVVYVLQQNSEFCDNIGFRYCMYKQCKLTAATSYWNMRDYKKVNLPSEVDWLKTIGAFEWFEKDSQCVKRDGKTVPYYYLPIDTIKIGKVERVYDITVENVSSFIANGIVVHNCGQIYPQRDMPFTEQGITPDLIMNPHALPSRMTVNQLMESVLGKSCCMEGDLGDSTPFSDSSVDVAESLCKRLGMNGFEQTGKEMLYNGITGEPMGLVFIGTVYYQRLKHMVDDKMHARAQGPNATLTRQPLEGRSRKGGLRFGEMERDCATKGTLVSLSNNLSIAIEDMTDPIWEVLGWDPEKKGLVRSKQTAFMDKGVRDCVKLTLEDGRVLKCTPDHPLLLENGEWRKAKDIDLCNERVVVSVTSPRLKINEEMKECNGWSLELHDIVLRTDTIEEYLKTLAFVRILGYLLFDGHITKQHKGSIYLGHLIDTETCQRDLKYFMNPPAICTEKHCFTINLSKSFMDNILKLDGLTIGAKVNQEAKLPSFLLNQCPLSIVREFLGAMFGADGHTCCLGMHRGKRDILTSISLSKSKPKRHQESLIKMMSDIRDLLARFDINEVTIQNPKEISDSKKKTSRHPDDKVYEVVLHLSINELRSFSTKIGFRYCCHKSQRLEAGVSYKRLRDEVTRQHNWIVARVDEITNYTALKKANPKKIVGTKKAVNQAIAEMEESEPLIHPYAIPSTHDISDHLLKNTKFGKFRSKGFPNAYEFMEQVGALGWFDKYGVEPEARSLPVMFMKVLGRHDIGEHPVYDISVAETTSFLAEGVVAHNCMIGHGTSRFLKERLYDQSDPYVATICNKCGNFSTTRKHCKACSTDDISRINLPYVSKLVMQELNGMLIKCDISAEDKK